MDEIDIHAQTPRQAIVARALQARYPQSAPRNSVRDAQAILLALDEHDSDQAVATDPGPPRDFVLTATQTIRLEVARMLGEQQNGLIQLDEVLALAHVVEHGSLQPKANETPEAKA